MRALVFFSLVMCAACGNWSNEDLVFISALPRSDELKSQLASATNKQPLSIGDPSGYYDDAKNTSEDFNKAIDNVLRWLDEVRKIPPTTRADDKRIWGPYADDKNPGFEAKIEITRIADKNYSWSIDMRPRNGQYFTVGGGQFTQTTDTLRKGIGSFFFDGKTARDNLKTTKTGDDSDRIDIRYETDRDPRRVSIDIDIGDGVNGSYAYNGKADTSAVLRWTVTTPKNVLASKIRLTAGWDTKTAGQLTYEILEGMDAGTVGTECWDPGHIIVYQHYTVGDAGVEAGDAGACTTVPTLDPL